MISATPPTTSAAAAEQALIQGIMEGTYPAGTSLPAERGLAASAICGGGPPAARRRGEIREITGYPQH
jgi:hypothetical protein